MTETIGGSPEPIATQNAQHKSQHKTHHKSQWRLNQVTDELNARPFPRFGLPTAIFRLCLSGDGGFASLQNILATHLPELDWQDAAANRLMRGRRDAVQYNIERHTEFVSLTLIDETPDGAGQSAARHLPDEWLSAIDAEIVVAVDCQCSARGAARESWTCASRLEGGLVDAYFDFKIAEDGHTKIALDFAAEADMRDIGRIALQVVEIETYRSFAALGLPQARSTQARLVDIANRVPADGEALLTDDSAGDAAAAKRFASLSGLAGELETIWRETSFRFSACEAYWALVQARLASLQETALDNRITVGGFLQRRLSPAIATYVSTEKRRHDLADQVGNMTSLLQTRIELGLQRQNADLLASLNQAAARQLRLQHTVEGVSTVAISYYLVNLLGYPLDWALASLPPALATLNPLVAQTALVAITVPLVWVSIRRLLRASIDR